jgi:hypothetical protein
MGYKLLGWIVWNGARWYLRRKLGRAAGPVVAVAVLAGAGAAAAAAANARRRG